MKRLVLIFAFLSMFFAPPIASQETVRIDDHVSVLRFRDADDAATNVGWIEAESYVLAIDAHGSQAWSRLQELADEGGSEKVRYAVFTSIGQAGADANVPDGWIQLSVSPDVAPSIDNRVITLPSPTRLGNEASRVELFAVEPPSSHRQVVFAPASGVLFVGDLVWLFDGDDLLPGPAWIEALTRLERLVPSQVVPSSGPIEHATVLSSTRRMIAGVTSLIELLIDAGKTREQIVDSVRTQFSDRVIGGFYDHMVGLRPAETFIARLGLREGPPPSMSDPQWTRPKKVVIADMWPGRTHQLARVAPGVEVAIARDREHAAELVSDADAMLGWLTPEILAEARQLRWVALYSAGVESYLQIPGFAESDIVLTNGQRLYAPGGAEHVLGLVLALSRRLSTAFHLQSERRWDTRPMTGPTPVLGDGSEMGELRGKTLLVAGLGGIGTEVARLAHGIGMRVNATRASRREGPDFVDYVGLSSELLDLATDADVVVNCVPLTSETEQMFDDEFFSALKPTAYFINIGRGKTVDTDALVRAIRDGRIAGAGLDVTDPEPLPSDHELWGLPNVLITPHVGGDSEMHMERIWLLFRENLRRFVSGEALLSVVNKQRGY